MHNGSMVPKRWRAHGGALDRNTQHERQKFSVSLHIEYESALPHAQKSELSHLSVTGISQLSHVHLMHESESLHCIAFNRAFLDFGLDELALISSWNHDMVVIG